jgi:membrane protease subunit (stomatin/prohibitin family)
MNRVGIPLAAVLLLLAGTAQASQQGQGVVNSWKAADKCAKQAQAAYPDYNAEANAKRDAKLKECLNAGNLAPRQPLSPPPPR